MEKFKNGDIVQLKSGGPKMTVSLYNERNNSFRCTWFVDTELKTGWFEADTLKKVEEK